MNIKQVYEQSGVSRQNIRFYEKEGLISPRRNWGNDYRDYTDEDVRTLKLIRMLQMPLPRIKLVLQGETSLERELLEQKQALEQQVQQPEKIDGFFAGCAGCTICCRLYSCSLLCR